MNQEQFMYELEKNVKSIISKTFNEHVQYNGIVLYENGFSIKITFESYKMVDVDFAIHENVYANWLEYGISDDFYLYIVEVLKSDILHQYLKGK